MKIQKSYNIDNKSFNKIHFKHIEDNFYRIISEQMTMYNGWQIMWTGVGLFHKDRYYGIFKHRKIDNTWFDKSPGTHYLSGIIGIHLGTVISDNHIHMTMINMSGIFGMTSYEIFIDKKESE